MNKQQVRRLKWNITRKRTEVKPQQVTNIGWSPRITTRWSVFKILVNLDRRQQKRVATFNNNTTPHYQQKRNIHNILHQYFNIWHCNVLSITFIISIYHPNNPYNSSHKKIEKNLKIIMTKLKKWWS
jgi:hypothetical protein